MKELLWNKDSIKKYHGVYLDQKTNYCWRRQTHFYSMYICTHIQTYCHTYTHKQSAEKVLARPTLNGNDLMANTRGDLFMQQENIQQH